MFGKKKAESGPEWTKTGSFMNKPDKGWLHSEQSLREGGVCYAVRYVGCIPVEKSMRTLQYDMRQQVTREAILRCCEVAGYQLTKRKKANKNISKILGDIPNMSHSGSNTNLTISATGIKLAAIDTGRKIGSHDMQGISFASGGEKECADMIGYVAKDDVNGRACHVLDCGGGLAYDVINTIGQAFEIRYKIFLENPPQAMEVPGRFSETSIFEDAGEPQYNELNDAEYADPQQVSSGYKVPLPLGRGASGGDSGVYASLHNPGGQQGRGYASPYRTITSSGYDVPRTSSAAPDNRESLEFAAGAIYDEPSGRTSGTAFYENPLASKKDPRAPQRLDSLTRNIMDEPVPSGHFSGPTNGAAFSNRMAFNEPLPPPPPMATHPEFAASNPPLKPPPKPVPYALSKTEKSNQRTAPAKSANDVLKDMDWFHGRISRNEAELLLEDEGDFLVRESKSQPGQYVLSGVKNNTKRHLLLVDPQGKVRTKDKVFENVDELVKYHLLHKVPIISAGSEVLIITPVIKG